MLGYPYIEELFRNVLKESKVIQGRFFISPHWGTDINSGNLEQVLEGIDIDDKMRKVPLCVMMPPRSTGKYQYDNIKDGYDIYLLFLTGTYFTGTGEVKQPKADIPNKSGHKITEDWHDMKRCAIAFMNTLDKLRDKGLGQYFTISSSQEPAIDPVSTVGNKNLSGVKLTFKANLNIACEVEDYSEGYLDRIVIPTIDTHPEHLH